MTEYCANCGYPLTGGEGASGLCPNCRSGAGSDVAQRDRGLAPGGGWNPPGRLGALGAIGSGVERPESDSGENQVRDRIVSQVRESGVGAGGADGSYGSYREQLSAGLYGLDRPLVEQPGLETYDPDRPPWGLGAAIGVWLASVAAILILPNIAVLVWLGYQRVHGLVIPADREQLEKLLAQPSVALIAVLSSLAAHLVTLAIVWAVVTGFGRRSLWKAPEWKWSGLTPIAKSLFVVGVVVLMIVLDVLLGAILPESRESEFDRLLKTSADVRVVVAFLAVFTAPLVEEWVYRGLLYAGLRRVAGVWPSVLVVAILFAGVHFPQYWGAWAGLISITVLSLTLTIIRAKTKSILPCVAVHVVFNAINSLFILTRHY